MSPRKKKREIEHLERIEKRFFIFCEGEKTEPNYFRGFKDSIESNPVYRNTVRVVIEGLGTDTIRVIDFAENYIKENSIKNADVWCVYDKDDFPAQNFNAVSEKANGLNSIHQNITYYVAWSNQCIEYWFILHFDWYESNNDRKMYLEYLANKFKQIGLKKYEKNNKEIFTILTYSGNPKHAIKRANKRLCDCEKKSEADSAPATRVVNLVLELVRFLPDDVKKRYI